MGLRLDVSFKENRVSNVALQVIALHASLFFAVMNVTTVYFCYFSIIIVCLFFFLKWLL